MASHSDLLDVLDPFGVIAAGTQRLAADEALLALVYDVAAASIGVVSWQGGENFRQPDALRRHPVGVEPHFECLIEPANGVDFGNAFHLPQLRGDLPFEQ